jgi:hypothetical protein
MRETGYTSHEHVTLALDNLFAASKLLGQRKQIGAVFARSTLAYLLNLIRHLLGRRRSCSWLRISRIEFRTGEALREWRDADVPGLSCFRCHGRK